MSDDTFKLGLKYKLQHGVLLEALLKRGWNQAEAARFIGVGPSTFGRWINLQEVPRRLTEEQVEKLKELTGKNPEKLWPDYVRSQDFLDAPKSFVEIRNVDRRRLYAAMFQRSLPASPEKVYLRNKLREEIVEALKKALYPREAKVIALRYLEDMTQDEAKDILKVTRTRIGQLEGRALRKLRHPRFSKILRLLQDMIDSNEP